MLLASALLKKKKKESERLRSQILVNIKLGIFKNCTLLNMT